MGDAKNSRATPSISFGVTNVTTLNNPNAASHPIIYDPKVFFIFYYLLSKLFAAFKAELCSIGNFSTTFTAFVHK